MAGAITDDLKELAADEMTVQPGSLNQFGEWAASGDSFTVPCHLSVKNRLVKDSQGQEQVSKVKATVMGVYNLTVDGHRYDLPSDFDDPRTELIAIVVGRPRHEEGAHHEVVMF